MKIWNNSELFPRTTEDTGKFKKKSKRLKVTSEDSRQDEGAVPFLKETLKLNILHLPLDLKCLSLISLLSNYFVL